jgi:hypothetical protein
MIGQTVSHYRIIERLSGEGMGDFYGSVDTAWCEELVSDA